MIYDMIELYYKVIQGKEKDNKMEDKLKEIRDTIDSINISIVQMPKSIVYKQYINALHELKELNSKYNLNLRLPRVYTNDKETQDYIVNTINKRYLNTGKFLNYIMEENINNSIRLLEDIDRILKERKII